jgi:hypothetical protein
MALEFCRLQTRAWDQIRARHLTCEAEQALRRLQAKSHEASNGLSARMEVLMAEKRAAYETRNIEHYEVLYRP